MTASNRVPWESLDQKTFEDVVAVLISRLNPEAQRIDGSGGDGGRDVQVQADDGLVIFELKSFTGRMASPQRKQVKDSLKRVGAPSEPFRRASNSVPGTSSPPSS